EVAADEPQALLLGRALEDRHDEVVLLHLAVLLEAHLLREEVELGQELRLQLAEVEPALAALVAAAAAAAVVLVGLGGGGLGPLLGRGLLGGGLGLGPRLGGRRRLDLGVGAAVGDRLVGAVLGRAAPAPGGGAGRLGLVLHLVLARAAPPADGGLLGRRGCVGLAALGSWAHRVSVPSGGLQGWCEVSRSGPTPSDRHARLRGIAGDAGPGSSRVPRACLRG